MRSAVLASPRTLRVEHLDDPRPTGTEVLLEVSACGICGTDREIFHGRYPVRHPLVMGHEYAGTVVATGEAVTTLQVGDRVAVDPNIVDDTCSFCRRGLRHLCSGLSPLGVSLPGGFSTRSLVPERYAFKLPPGMDLVEASLVEPLACCIHGIDQAGVELNDVVVVLGAGPIGCLLIRLARIRGARAVIAVEPNEARREHAIRHGASVACGTPDESRALQRELGADIGADVVIEASGTEMGAEAAISLARRGGTILLFGVYPSDRLIPLSPFRVNEDELRIVGSFNNPDTHPDAIRLLGDGRIDAAGIITDELGLDDLARAMDLENFPRAGKIVVRPAD